MDIIEIEHLKKYFGQVKAVDDVSFRVEEGEFFAFLGVNGAGKSTTISVLCGKEQKTDGIVKIAGRDVEENLSFIKRKIGVVFQDSALDGSLSVLDNLRYRAALYGIKGEAFKRKKEELCALFGLEELLSRPVSKLSGGQRRRADIARALVHDPKILILDEPTTGLDPQTRRTVWDVVHALRKVRGLTVFLTTHYMEEAADADRVVILDGGKVKANDTPLNLKNRYTGDFITLYHVQRPLLEKLSVPYTWEGETVKIQVADTAQATALILQDPALFQDYEITKGGMDDVFLAVTGKRTEDKA